MRVKKISRFASIVTTIVVLALLVVPTISVTAQNPAGFNLFSRVVNENGDSGTEITSEGFYSLQADLMAGYDQPFTVQIESKGLANEGCSAFPEEMFTNWTFAGEVDGKLTVQGVVKRYAGTLATVACGIVNPNDGATFTHKVSGEDQQGNIINGSDLIVHIALPHYEPVIDSVEPNDVAPGETMTIFGQNFTDELIGIDEHLVRFTSTTDGSIVELFRSGALLWADDTIEITNPINNNPGVWNVQVVIRDKASAAVGVNMVATHLTLRGSRNSVEFFNTNVYRLDYSTDYSGGNCTLPSPDFMYITLEQWLTIDTSNWCSFSTAGADVIDEGLVSWTRVNDVWYPDGLQPTLTPTAFIPTVTSSPTPTRDAPPPPTDSPPGETPVVTSTSDVPQPPTDVPPWYTPDPTNTTVPPTTIATPTFTTTPTPTNTSAPTPTITVVVTNTRVPTLTPTTAITITVIPTPTAATPPTLTPTPTITPTDKPNPCLPTPNPHCKPRAWFPIVNHPIPCCGK